MGHSVLNANSKSIQPRTISTASFQTLKFVPFNIGIEFTWTTFAALARVSRINKSFLCSISCWTGLTSVSPGEGTGATMSDNEEDQAESNANLYEGGMDGADSLSFGPLVPTETERSLMERVRQELKHELKQGYKDKIVDIREEILRKRRAGKLPGDTTSLLKAWWQSHSKWPYPTEEDKARLVQETGLQLKQINNWFINQRKRNWHTNPSSSSGSKSKRKSSGAGESSNQSFM
ncbi:Homeobox protein knotted-1-like 3 isoform B [Glycine soja]|uniref:Homeobox protein knotted-1-like 3 isoform B n=1 Tax=Glycine soja TaxID=3848 RepID=A0A445IZ02_GLYSO|nr:Homeobox protein knotted-1-like 3 isoform B [Glycine soja]